MSRALGILADSGLGRFPTSKDPSWTFSQRWLDLLRSQLAEVARFQQKDYRSFRSRQETQMKYRIPKKNGSHGQRSIRIPKDQSCKWDTQMQLKICSRYRNICGDFPAMLDGWNLEVTKFPNQNDHICLKFWMYSPGTFFFINKIQTFPDFYQTLPFLLGIREENHQQKSSLGVESSWSCHADGRTSMPRWHWWLVILFSCWAADFNGNHPENPGRTPKPVEGWFGSFSYDLPGFVHPRFSVFWSINSSFDPFLCCLHECLWLSRGKIKHIQDDVFLISECDVSSFLFGRRHDIVDIDILSCMVNEYVKVTNRRKIYHTYRWIWDMVQ